MPRLDTHISEKFGFSRNKIQNFIHSGLILVNGKIATKNSQKIDENDEITILENQKIHWVSRSAEKLFGFFENHHDIKAKVCDAICLDV